MRHFAPVLLCSICIAALGQQEAVTIRVDASETVGSFKPVWSFFGYDEPNYTYTENGVKLINELAALSNTPVHIRTHNLLTTGNGAPGLKWGSTNAYTEDPAGSPVYDWSLVDKILDTYVRAGAKPFVEIGFMPKALSSQPMPYTPAWKTASDFDKYYLGWSYPPKSYEKWGALVYELVRHAVEKYGRSEAEAWNWEVWNEPDISYWRGTPEEYDKLYDFTASAVKRALAAARVGGPASTSPRNPKAAAFLRQFLVHCSSGRNYASGETGAPLDFISFHAKGRPELVEGRVRMGISEQMKDVSAGFDIVRSFEKFRDLPIFLTESDPEGCGACSSRENPANAYRNGTLYPAYVAVAMKAMLQLAAKNDVNLQGILTWAFEFENQPYFAGFRELATNGIDKPVLNVFRMAGLMRGDLVKTDSDGALALEAIVRGGVRQRSDVDALATRSERKLAVMVWNYRDDDVTSPPVTVNLFVSGIAKEVRRLLVRHYRIDEHHSNAYTVWKEIGEPQTPNTEQYAQLEAAGQLQVLDSPRWINNGANLSFLLPLQAISLIEFSW